MYDKIRQRLSRNNEKGSPRLSILISMALSNLRFKKLRTSLTIAGVVIGIGSIVFLVSLGLGLQNLVTKRVVSSDSVRTVEVTSPDPNIVHLSNDTADRFARLDKVGDVTKVYSYPGKVSIDSATTDSVIYGVDSNYVKINAPQLLAGKFPAQLSSNEAVISSTLLQTLNLKDPKQAVGLNIAMTVVVPDVASKDKASKTLQWDMVVRGVVEAGAGTDTYVSNELFYSEGLRDYDQVRIVVDHRNDVGTIRKQIEALGLSTTSPIDTLEQINQLFAFFNFILIGFGSIGMLIAVLGMLNTLTISLLERTQEIGLIVSLGGTESDIKKLFIAESLILSAVGGILGLIMAFGGGFLIDWGLNSMASRQGLSESFSLFSLPLTLIVATVAFITIVGLAVVYVPAKRAARINPITALRRE